MAASLDSGHLFDVRGSETIVSLIVSSKWGSRKSEVLRCRNRTNEACNHIINGQCHASEAVNLKSQGLEPSPLNPKLLIVLRNHKPLTPKLDKET